MPLPVVLGVHDLPNDGSVLGDRLDRPDLAPGLRVRLRTQRPEDA